jgi:asparagine synthase (glutamine-hydrolysing)
MFRFLGLAWNSASDTANAAATRLLAALNERADWTRVAGLPGLEVFMTGSREGANGAYGLGSHGVVLGKLFRRAPIDQSTGPDPVESIDDPERLSETGGRALVDAYWGRHPAVLPVAARRRARRLLPA